MNFKQRNGWDKEGESQMDKMLPASYKLSGKEDLEVPLPFAGRINLLAVVDGVYTK